MEDLPVEIYFLGCRAEKSHLNWELGERDLSIPVTPPNDILESESEVPLRRGFTYRDLADAVTEAACQEGAGGHICNVTSVELS